MGQETGGAVPARQTGIDEKWWCDHVPLCYLGEHNGLTPFGRSGGLFYVCQPETETSSTIAEAL
uniref:hypothetical protein n=2 Tax=Glutamicibacter arilaitensis TaxID=256701 RepID=UPI001D02FE27